MNLKVESLLYKRNRTLIEPIGCKADEGLLEVVMLLVYGFLRIRQFRELVVASVAC